MTFKKSHNEHLELIFIQAAVTTTPKERKKAKDSWDDAQLKKYFSRK